MFEVDVGEQFTPVSETACAPHLEAWLSILSTDPTQSHSGSVSVCKFDSCRLKGMFDDSEGCSTRLSFFSLKLADGYNAHPRGIRELLLTPIEKSASCSALGRCEHAAKWGS
jgi:hypothetical protein